MSMSPIQSLKDGLVSSKFKQMSSLMPEHPECKLILKRQTWHTNHAVVLIELSTFPDDFDSYLKKFRKAVAFKVGFFPVLYGLGIQLIIRCRASVKGKINLEQYVDTFDNQWAIFQSIFLIDMTNEKFEEARTWGQIFTGQYQDRISDILSQQYNRGVV